MSYEAALSHVEEMNNLVLYRKHSSVVFDLLKDELAGSPIRQMLHNWVSALCDPFFETIPYNPMDAMYSGAVQSLGLDYDGDITREQIRLKDNSFTFTEQYRKISRYDTNRLKAREWLKHEFDDTDEEKWYLTPISLTRPDGDYYRNLAMLNLHADAEDRREEIGYLLDKLKEVSQCQK